MKFAKVSGYTVCCLLALWYHCCVVAFQVKLLEELDGHVIDCAMDQNGNHVIRKCFDCVNPVHLDFIIEAFEGMVSVSLSSLHTCTHTSTHAHIHTHAH